MMMGKNVYGIPMQGMSAVFAERFLHAQSALCSLTCCSGIISMIFTFVLIYQIGEAKTSIIGTTSVDVKLAADLPPQDAFIKNIEDQMAYTKWTSPIGLLFSLCFMSVWIVVARHFVQERNVMGLKFCCIFEGLCSCLACCEGLGWCIYFICICTALATISDPASVCKDTSSISWLGYTTPLPSTTATAPAVDDCVKLLTGLQTPFQTCAIWVFFMAIFACCAASICGTGAKFAKDTEEVFEDEEFGGGYGGQYGGEYY